VDWSIFPSGIQVGDVDQSSARVSVWMTPDEATLSLAKAEGDAWIEQDTSISLVRDGVCGQIDLEGLEPDTAYSVVVLSGGIRSAVTRFRTALSRDGFRQITIGATACLAGNQPWPSMSHVARHRPDAFLFLGDTVYADGASSLDEYRSYWSRALKTQGLVDVTANTSVIATWDDHEVVNDFAGLVTSPERFAAGLTAFREGLPQREGEGGGIWRKISWGEVVDIFVLDGRGERDGESQYISPEQLEWLKMELVDSPARFKLLMNSVPLTDYKPIFGEVLADDRWQGYPDQRGELLDFIVGNEIEGVFSLTGDFHMSTASRVDVPGGVAEELWEIMVGTGGSFLNIAADLVEKTDQFPVIFAEWCTCLLHLDPGMGRVQVEWVGDDGSVLETFELSL